MLLLLQSDEIRVLSISLAADPTEERQHNKKYVLRTAHSYGTSFVGKMKTKGLVLAQKIITCRFVCPGPC